MPNAQLTAEKIAEQAALSFQENLAIFHTLTDNYSQYIGGGTGASVKVKRSMFSNASGDGADASGTLNDQDQGSITLTPNFDKHQKIIVTEAEKKYNIRDFKEQILDAPMRKLASEAEQFVHDYLGQNSSGLIGAAGTTPTTTSIIDDAAEYMDLFHIPNDKRTGFLNPSLKRSIITYMQQLNSQAQKMPPSLVKGLLHPVSGIELFQHSIYNSHTTGNYGGTPLVNGASQTTSWTNAKNTYTQNLITDGWSAGATIKKGDKFTINNVFSIHPETKISTGKLQVFNVMADATADGSGNMTLSITPPIMTTSNTGTTKNYATVTTVPADNAIISVVSGAANTTYRRSLVYHPDAIAFASLPYEAPESKATDYSVQSINGKLPVFIERDRVSSNASDVIYLRVRFGIQVRDPRFIATVYGH